MRRGRDRTRHLGALCCRLPRLGIVAISPTASAARARGSGDRRRRTCAQHTVANDKGEGYERRQQPKIVEGNGEAAEPKKHAKIDGIAREAVGSPLDDGGGRRLVGTFEPRVMVAIAQATSTSARASTVAPSQPAGSIPGTNGKGMSQLSASPANAASAHAIGGRMMT